MKNNRHLTAQQQARLENAVKEYDRAHTTQPSAPVLSTQEKKRMYHERLRASIEKDNQIATKVGKEQQKRRLDDWQAKIDRRWYDASIDSPTMFPEVKHVIQQKMHRWEVGEGLDQLSLLFAGSYGRGKTWSAYAYAYELIKNGYLTASQVYSCTEVEMAAIATSGFKRGEGISDLLSPQFKFFLIDDVGRGAFGQNQNRGEIWFSLLNHVYSKGLTIVMTTNLSTAKSPNGDGDSPLSRWIGKASIERLRAIVGHDGYLEFTSGMQNMREEVARRSQKEFEARQRGS